MPHAVPALDRQSGVDDLLELSLTYLAQLKKAGGRAFSPLGLSYGQAMLLTFISRGCTAPTELAAVLGIVPPAVSALITNLVDLGLLERQNHKADARRVSVSLTSRGVETCRAMRDAWRKNFPVDLESFSDEELEHLIEAARIATRRGLI